MDYPGRQKERKCRPGGEQRVASPGRGALVSITIISRDPASIIDSRHSRTLVLTIPAPEHQS